MVSHLFFYQLVLIALVWLCLMLHWTWPSDPATCPLTPEPTPPVPKRHRERKPFAGLTTKPHCDACAHANDLRPEAPCPPPPRLVATRGRRRQVDTSMHFCPNPDCAYRSWVGWGNLRANGHPSGGPWRQRPCTSWLRIIVSAPKPATIPPLHHHVRGLCHDSAVVFLSARDPRTSLALCHAPSCLAEPRPRFLAAPSRA
jgi:hypothetical protein